MRIGIISDLHIAYDRASQLADSKDRALESLLDEILRINYLNCLPNFTLLR